MTFRFLIIASVLSSATAVSAQVTPRTPPVPPIRTVPERVRPLDHDRIRVRDHLLEQRANFHLDAPHMRIQEPKKTLDLDARRLDGRVQSPRPDLDLHIADPSGRRLISPQSVQTWYQDDPADSLFRAAHSLFAKQEYRAGATRFAEVRTRHPNSRYFCDAAYYEAFSRYRLGTPAELRTAHSVLEGLGERCATASRRADLPELRARVDGALARTGDAAAADRVRRAASQGQNVCDSEERRVKIDALGALAQVDPQAADPVIRTVLNTRDACSAPVRRQALSLAARRNDAQSVALIAQSAKNDSDAETRGEAVRMLARFSNDAAVAALEDLLRTSNDERIHAIAADAMARSDHPRAHAGVRALIERNDVAERTRIAAISALAARPNVTHDYWRSLYPRLESVQLRQAVISAISRSDAPEAQQFVLGVARNASESPAVRSTAISRIRGTAPIGDLYQLLQSAESRSLRLSIVNALVARKEPEATARLIDIAKTSTDPEIRRVAISALGRAPRKDDPTVVKALGEILSGGQP